MTTVVEMIGAGPGDPDLLTLRAEASLAAATMVVTDAAVAHLAAAFAPDATVAVTAAGGATVDGDAVRILIGAARRGRRVVRLYRGDPWLHPAYAVESGLLATAGVEHVAVPGPPVELAIPAAAGVAVHHPPTAVTVTIALAGSLPAATDPARTLVAAADDAAGAAARLAGRGGDPDMPAAVVAGDGGARSAAGVRRGRLGEIAADRTIGAGVLVVGAAAAPTARPLRRTDPRHGAPAASVADARVRVGHAAPGAGGVRAVRWAGEAGPAGDGAPGGNGGSVGRGAAQVAAGGGLGGNGEAGGREAGYVITDGAPGGKNGGSVGRGAVHVVGAGPGDPSLLARRAARLLAASDVVVADRRGADRVAALAPSAERVYVGRTPEGPAWPVDRVVELLARHASAGHQVVRLEDGDPFVCAAVSEELAALVERGIAATITPGVTAGTAAPLAAGNAAVPGARLTIVSGAEDPEAAPVAWTALAEPGATLVVLTGRAHQRRIATRLRGAGASGTTPVALVHRATGPGARTVTTTLARLGATRLQPPVTAVIGPLVIAGPAPDRDR